MARAMVQKTCLLVLANRHYLPDGTQSISILANQIGKNQIELKSIVVQAQRKDIYDITETAWGGRKDIKLCTRTILIIPHSKLLDHLRHHPHVIRYYNYILLFFLLSEIHHVLQLGFNKNSSIQNITHSVKLSSSREKSV